MPTIALTGIVDGSLIVAADHRNNYSAIQSAVNALDAANWAAGKIFDPIKFTQNAATAGQVLLWDNTNAKWIPSGGRGTVFPATPIDGDEFVYTADATAGIQWRFKYNAGSASVYKWEFIGGPPLFAEVLTLETTVSTTYVDLTTVGPQITLARAGDYNYTVVCEMQNSLATAANYASVKLGAAVTDDSNAAISGGAVSLSVTPSRRRTVTGMAAAAVLKVQYKASAGTGTFLRRALSVIPIRVS